MLKMIDRSKSIDIFRILKLILLTIFLAAPVLSIAATTYYVNSSTGNDSNLGTQSSPWRTISKVNSVSFAPGDSVLFNRGGIWTGTRLGVSSSGTSGHPITYGAYGTGDRPILNANGSQADAAWCIGVHDITIEGLNFKNGTSYALQVANAHDITISDCEASGATWTLGGNIIVNGPGTSTYNITITHCIVHNATAGHGIWVGYVDWGGPKNVLVEYCTSYNNGTDPTQDHGIYFAYVENGTMQYNTSYGNGADGLANRGCVGPIIIQYNHSYNNGNEGIIISGGANGGSGSKCIYNIVHDNAGSGIWVGKDNDSWLIANNTLVNNGDSSILMWSDSGDYPIGHTIKNNILYQDHAVVSKRPWNIENASTSSNCTIDNNCVYYKSGDGYVATVADAVKTWTQWKALGVEAHGINDDADFVTNYTNFHVQSISPCRDVGENLGLTKDYWGTSVPQENAPDIGAHEYMGAGTTLSAYASASPTSGQAPLAASFTGSASGGTPPYSYSWAFGDGGSSTAQNPSHTYSSAGAYTATLTVTDSASATATSTVNISVLATLPLSANIVASPTSGQAPLTTNFSGSATGGVAPYSFQWAFGDAATSTSQNPSHTYSTAGTYTAVLTVTDSKAATNSKSVSITGSAATAPVVASASATPTSGQAPLAVNFTGSATGGTTPYSYSWAFGDGGSSTTQNPSHTYSTAGTYTATLTVTDSKAATNSKSVSISVTAATTTPVVASASASPTSGQAPMAVTFSGSATGGITPYSYSWAFGDGGSSTTQNPSHTYSTAGTFNATLTVTDSGSSTNSKSVSITVTAAASPVVVTASANPTSGLAPLAVVFSGTATGGTTPYTYSWSFGDGGTSNTQNPGHIYAAVGSYNVTLTVSDSASRSGNGSVTISVNPVSGTNLVLAAETGSPAPGEGGTTDPAPGNHTYSVGSNVHVSSIPNTDYRFSKWSGSVASTALFSSTTALTMDTSKSLSATFCTKCADVNGDLKITPGDAQKVFDIYLKRIANPTWCELENADVNGDGTKLVPKVTPADANYIFKQYIRKGILPGDCSGNIRTLTLSTQGAGFSNVALMLDKVIYTSGQDIQIPVIVDSPTDIQAFGFDLAFPAGLLTYVRTERTDLTAGYDQVDANLISDGTLRVGGYKTQPGAGRSAGELVTLVFRVNGDARDLSRVAVVATYDDIQYASVRNGMIDVQKSIPTKENRSPRRSPVKKSL